MHISRFAMDICCPDYNIKWKTYLNLKATSQTGNSFEIYFFHNRCLNGYLAVIQTSGLRCQSDGNLSVEALVWLIGGMSVVAPVPVIIWTTVKYLCRWLLIITTVTESINIMPGHAFLSLNHTVDINTFVKCYCYFRTRGDNTDWSCMCLNMF